MSTANLPEKRRGSSNATPSRANEAANWTGFSSARCLPVRFADPRGTVFASRFGFWCLSFVAGRLLPAREYSSYHCFVLLRRLASDDPRWQRVRCLYIFFASLFSVDAFSGWFYCPRIATRFFRWNLEKYLLHDLFWIIGLRMTKFGWRCLNSKFLLFKERGRFFVKRMDLLMYF